MEPLPVKDFLVSNEIFLLKYNRTINAWQTTPALPPKTLQTYYPKDVYLSHTDKAAGIKASIYLWIKRLNIQTKLNWVSKTNRCGKLLDFGAGNGAFVQAAAKKGWSTYAFESSETAKKTLTTKGIRQISDIHPDDNYDVITLWHVFEHLPNPKQQMKRFYEALAPGGILVLAVPNHNSWDAKHYGAYWAAYDVPRHLWHYKKASITGLANEVGFNVLKSHNMFWDAFYIALISEQYKNSKSAWILGFFKGLYSNIIGWRQKNTSSLTFILQKPE